jgi:uncharacterized membrane protein YdbT with pleckstrin-like domain
MAAKPFVRIRMPPMVTINTAPSLPVSNVEYVVWDSRASQLENLREYIRDALMVVPIVLMGLVFDWWLVSLLAVPALLALWRFIVVWRKSYQLTDRRLRIKTGVFRRVRINVDLFHVLEVQLKSPVVQQRRGRGTLRVTTSDPSRPMMVLFAVKRPEEVKQLIMQYAEARYKADEAPRDGESTLA